MDYTGQTFDLTPVNLRRRRFLMVSVAMLALMGILLGVSFLQTTGTSEASVTGGDRDWVFPISDEANLPSGVEALKYTGAAAIADDLTLSTDDFSGTAETPTWTPVQDSAGTLSATDAGDLAVIDARVNDLLVTVYMTDLHELQQAYSSFAFKMNVYECTSASQADNNGGPATAGCDAATDWVQASTTVIPAAGSIFTNTDGFLTFALKESSGTGSLFLITFEAGGSYFCFDATPGANSSENADFLSPEFYFQAKATA